MPCNDIKDKLILIFSDNLTLEKYTLNKETCSAEVGDESLLLDSLKGRKIQELGEISFEDLCLKLNPENKNQEFLIFKHAQALSTTAKVFLGEKTEDKNGGTVIETVDYEDDKIIINSFINFGRKNINFPSCELGCGGCGKK